MFKYLLSVILFICFSNLASTQNAPLDIIQKSIEYHDPDGLLKSGKIILDLVETRPNGSDRKTKVELHDAVSYTHLTLPTKRIV